MKLGLVFTVLFFFFSQEWNWDWCTDFFFVLPGLELGLVCTELFCSSRDGAGTGVFDDCRLYAQDRL